MDLLTVFGPSYGPLYGLPCAAFNCASSWLSTEPSWPTFGSLQVVWRDKQHGCFWHFSGPGPRLGPGPKFGMLGAGFENLKTWRPGGHHGQGTALNLAGWGPLVVSNSCTLWGLQACSRPTFGPAGGGAIAQFLDLHTAFWALHEGSMLLESQVCSFFSTRLHCEPSWATMAPP